MDGSTFFRCIFLCEPAATFFLKMNRKKRRMLTIGLALIALLSACQKEPISRLMLTAEGMGGGSKMTVSGMSSYWQTGDAVNINGVESFITVSGSQAYVDGEFSADNYCIVFPSLNYQYRGGNVVTVVMPAIYQYKTSGGQQVLNAPMAYLGTAENGKVMMKHLTGALNVQITGPSGISIDRITIGTSQNRVMNGMMSFDLSDLENIGSSATDGNEIDRTVQMLFDNESFSTGTVQIPIPVLTGNVNFTVKVEGHVEGTKYTFERTQNTGGHLGRAELGTVTVDLNEGQPNVTLSALFSTSTIEGVTYYEIRTPKDLQLLSTALIGTFYRDDSDDWENRVWSYNDLNYRDANYRIVNDLNMEGISIKSLWHFAGIIDGNNHTISNLVVTESARRDDDIYYDQIGLLTSPNNATIQNLTINNLTMGLDFTSDPYGGYIGSIAGYSGNITVSNVNIINYQINNRYHNRLIVGGFFGESNSFSIENSSVSFANGQSLISGGSSYGNSNYGSLGGITGRGSCNAINVSVNFGNISFGFHRDNEYARSAKCLVGGVFGSTIQSLTPDVSNYNNITITGNITASGNSNVYTGKVYNQYYGGICYSSTNSFDGVYVSGLTINGE